MKRHAIPEGSGLPLNNVGQPYRSTLPVNSAGQWCRVSQKIQADDAGDL